jgi:septal ring factor EnvC (AmiA/AmiB activator)
MRVRISVREKKQVVAALKKQIAKEEKRLKTLRNLQKQIEDLSQKLVDLRNSREFTYEKEEKQSFEHHDFERHC